MSAQHEQRARLLRALGVTLAIDGGANVGQYAGDYLRSESGYAGRIVSFEPVPPTFARLAARAAGDPGWEVREAGLSDADESASITVPGTSSDLASFTPLNADGVALVNGDKGVAEAFDVRTVRLDGAGIVGPEDRVLLKLDVQGHEPQALAGAEGILDRVVLVECECPLVPIYAGQGTFAEVIAIFAALGFTPVGVHNNWLRQDGRAVDADVFLTRPTSPSSSG